MKQMTLAIACWLAPLALTGCRHDVIKPLHGRVIGAPDNADSLISKAAAGEWTGLCTINTGLRIALKWDGAGNCALRSLTDSTQKYDALCQMSDNQLNFTGGTDKKPLFMTCNQEPGPVTLQGKSFAEGLSCSTYQNNAPPLMTAWGCEILVFLPPATDLSSLPGAAADPSLPPVGQSDSSLCMFHNPVLPAGSVAPWAIALDKTYYIVLTSADTVTLRTTAKLEEMAKAPSSVIWQASADPSTPYKNNISGAKLYRFDNLWYLYLSGRTPDAADDGQRLFVLKSQGADPQGPYSFAAKLGDDAPSYSPSVYTSDAARYLLWAEDTSAMRCLYIAAMNDPVTLGTAGARISCPDYDWEKVGSPRNDAPVMLTYPGSGMMLITYSAGDPTSKDQSVGLIYNYNGRNDLTYGWSKLDTPTFKQNGSVYSPGHMVVTKAPNGTDDWFLYDGQDDPASGEAGRATRIGPFNFDPRNLPRFDQPIPSNRAWACPL